MIQPDLLLAGTSSTAHRMRWGKMMAWGNSAQHPFPWEEKCKLWWSHNRQNIRCPSLYSTTGIPHINACLPCCIRRPLVHGQTPSPPSPNLDADHAICFHSQPRLAELPNRPLPCQVHTFSSQRKAEAVDYDSHKVKSLYYIHVRGCFKIRCLRKYSPCPTVGCLRAWSANDVTHGDSGTLLSLPAAQPSCPWRPHVANTAEPAHRCSASTAPGFEGGAGNRAPMALRHQKVP